MNRLSPHKPPILRRLNGRPQACDPCRVRKVACDHTQPVCKRCVKRKQQNECTYTITGGGPVAQSSMVISQTSATALASGLPPRRHMPSPPALVTVNESGALQRREGQCRDAPTGTDTRSGSGYLGFTSHSTVYEEARNCLSSLQGFQSSLPQLCNYDRAAQPFDSSGPLASPTREMALVVLRNLPTPSECAIQLTSDPYQSSGWVRIAVHLVIKSLNEMYGSYLGASRSDSKLQEIAQFLSENTSKPLLENESDPNAWIAGFTGRNLRWESLGLMFTFRTNGVLELAPNGSYREALIDVSRVCLGLCIDLSRRLSHGNCLQLFLLSRRTVIESATSGDASLGCWRVHADAVALLTFLGIHAESDSALYRPNLCSEIRRRLAAYTFSLDHTVVMFTGRPPLMNHRYTSAPLPLDLSDEDLLAGAETLERAISALDSNGWNTDGTIYTSTFIRARTICAYLRAELVEIALGKSKNVSIDILLDIKERQIQAKAQFPACLTYRPAEVNDHTIPVHDIYSKVLVQLDHLQNLFVLERLLLRQSVRDDGNLLMTSFELVSLTLTFWSNKDRLLEARNDFEWLLMAFAAPGGGILCMELLDPTFTGTHPMNPKVTRASIIQNLSLLVAFLDWVHPPAPNADLCANCKSVIQHVLDHTLNTTVATSWPPATFDSIPLDFNFELLDTFGWARG